jgi:aspartate carbamoyltransferase catalytic subunit
VTDLLDVGDLDTGTTLELFRLSESFLEVSARRIPKVPALRGRTVVSLFYEDSTRTRLSFETAARRLSADVMNFSVGTSSVNKGESVRDTVETIEADRRPRGAAPLRRGARPGRLVDVRIGGQRR